MEGDARTRGIAHQGDAIASEATRLREHHAENSLGCDRCVSGVPAATQDRMRGGGGERMRGSDSPQFAPELFDPGRLRGG